LPFNLTALIGRRYYVAPGSTLSQVRNDLYYSIFMDVKAIFFDTRQSATCVPRRYISVRKGVHDNIDPHLNGFFVVTPAESEAVTVAPSAVNVGGT